MKAIIPVAGAGKNLRPLTYTQPKPLIPVAGKPIICYIIDQLTSLGVQDFVFIIGYLGEKIRDFVEQTYPDIHKTFVTQDHREGSGHAIWTARESFRDSNQIIIFFGDTILDVDFNRIIKSESSCVAVQKVKNPRDFGLVEFHPDGFVKRFVEKPSIPLSDMALVGVYKIADPSALIEGLDYNIRNNIRTDGEFPLTDGLMRMLERGIPFSTVKVDNWFDCGRKEILLETNALLLEREGYASSVIPEFVNTIVIPPVSIGEQCQIKNSIIGPHVTIGNHAVIESAIVKNSIIGNYASIREAVLQASVIGNDTAITGLRQSLNIGDNTEIDFR
ncbi:MAG: NTP transferase domain-containing protein [Saprospirales bacterium]|nr:NTP transferase domain-containing protein [Saprospirales bacterium]MBK6901676.1 NTP transferase domain-containing protein [Saprospirales bacterium]